jgi:hypothetical protein
VILDGSKSTFSALSSLASNVGTLRLLNGRGLVVTGDFANSGTLELSATSFFKAGGKLMQTAQGILKLHIASTSNSFVSAVTMAALGGTVDFAWTGPIPLGPARVYFMKAPVITGTFATLFTTLQGRVQTIAYTASTVTLVVSPAPFYDK